MQTKHYPKAVLRIPNPPVDGGSMNMDGSKKMVWHTTETAPTGFYRTKVYYHIQVREDPATGKILWEQYIPFDRASRGLRNDQNTPLQTNRDGDVNINVAIVGYARNSPYMSNALMEAIAEFMVWAEEEWGIPAVFPYAFQGGEAYGENGVGRLEDDQWDEANGSLGHQDVPDGNTHWDPGKLPVNEILELVEGLKYMAKFVDVPEEHWAYNAVEWMAETGLTVGSGTIDGKPAYKPEDPVTRAQMAVFLKRFHDKFIA